ncbi:MAG: pyrroloquinoline quinone biosynthesis protein PqqB [Alphaproteobacteria bacterium]
MKLIVLGAAAGGGFPQWNVASPNTRRSFAGDEACAPQTQCSLAASLDGADWVLLNASPDIRQQILATPELQPRRAPRSSPIRAVILTGADVDAIAGLLSLRERQPFTVWATEYVLGVLRANPIFRVLDRACVQFRIIHPQEAFEPLPGLSCRAIETPGKPPLFMEETDGIAPVEGSSIGIEIRSPAGRRAIFMPSCAEVTLDTLRTVEGADALFFDGTLCVDDEMIRTGEGSKTARRMGHVAMDEAITRLRDASVGKRWFIHINNTNPVLNRGSEERKVIEAEGWTIAMDGMRIDL